MPVSRKILFLTHWMTDITGSSVVILEAAKAFQQLGYDAHVGCMKLTSPMATLLQQNGIDAFQLRDRVDPGDYDVIWCQHVTFGIVDIESYVGRPLPAKVIFTHLSPAVPLELPTYALEKDLASAILCNSEETLEAIVSIQGKTGREIVFGNAGPSTFKLAQRDRSELVRVLLVSNHHVPELEDAATYMREQYNLHVEKLGVNTGVYRLVTPDDIAWADAVITIGKSVIYGLLGGLPVYVYGPHGGDGYLTDNNYQRNRTHNFSGRPSCAKKTGRQIAEEIVTERESSLGMMSNMQRKFEIDYCLDTFIEALSENITKSPQIYVQQEWLFQHQLYRNAVESLLIA